MKKLFYAVILSILLVAIPVFGAGSITSAVSGGSYIEVVWTGIAGSDYIEFVDAFGVTVTRFDIYVVLVTTDPAGSPTASYDITLVDESGVDIMGGELGDRHTSNSEQAMPYIGGGYGPRKVTGTLQVVVTNQAEAAATSTIRIYFYK